MVGAQRVVVRWGWTQLGGVECGPTVSSAAAVCSYSES